MVEVVLAEVVFGQIGDVGRLDMRDVGRPENADIHLGRVSSGAGCLRGLYWVRTSLGGRGGVLLLEGRWFEEKRDVHTSP